MTIPTEKLKAMLAGCDGLPDGPWNVTREGRTHRVISPAGDAELGNWTVAANVFWSATAEHLASCDPQTMRALLTEIIESREKSK